MKNLHRLLFLALFVFEQLNHYHILHFPLDFTWIGLMVSLGVAVGLLEGVNWAFRRSWGIELPWATWTYVLIAVSIDAAGDVFHLYSRLPWYDQVAHFSGGLIAGFVFMAAIATYARGVRQQYSPAAIAVYAYGLAMALGAAYEIEEYLEDFFTGSHRLGDGPDTANDLLMNALGAMVAVLALTCARRLRRPSA
jgi:hypothetical protein